MPAIPSLLLPCRCAGVAPMRAQEPQDDQHATFGIEISNEEFRSTGSHHAQLQQQPQQQQDGNIPVYTTGPKASRRFQEQASMRVVPAAWQHHVGSCPEKPFGGLGIPAKAFPVPAKAFPIPARSPPVLNMTASQILSAGYGGIHSELLPDKYLPHLFQIRLQVRFYLQALGSQRR